MLYKLHICLHTFSILSSFIMVFVCMHAGQCSLRVGQLKVDRFPRGCDGVDRLSVARGLLTCLRKDILVHQNAGQQVQWCTE